MNSLDERSIPGVRRGHAAMKIRLRNWYIRLPYVRSLRFRLVLLVLLASLPSLGLLFYTASQQRGDALVSAQQEATSLANLAAVDQQRIIDQNRRYLRTLARLPELRGTDMTQCASLVQALLGDNAYAYENIGIISRNGDIPCQASGLTSEYFTSNPGRLAKALASPDMTIGDIEYMPGAPAGTIIYVYPVANNAGVPDRLVFVTLRFGSLTIFAGQSNPPAGTVFRVFDDKEQLIAQYPADASAQPVPLLATPEAVTTPSTQGTNTTVTSTEGEEFLFARSDVAVTKVVNNSGPAFVSVALPRNAIVSRADALFQENVGRLAIVAVIAIVAAWISADLFTTGDSETRKRMVGEWYEAFSTGQLERIDELASPSLLDHSRAPGQAKGRDGIKQVITAFRTAFPDGKLTIRELIADHDKVVARVTIVGTHVGEFFGTPPSGQVVASEGDETFKFAGGMIVETWSLFGPLVAVNTVKERQAPKPEQKRSPGRRMRWWSKDDRDDADVSS